MPKLIGNLSFGTDGRYSTSTTDGRYLIHINNTKISIKPILEIRKSCMYEYKPNLMCACGYVENIFLKILFSHRQEIFFTWLRTNKYIECIIKNKYLFEH